MCEVLKLSRSTYYYLKNKTETVKKEDEDLVNHIKAIFKASRRTYGTRRIKRELAKLNIEVSRRKIGLITRKHGLISKYTLAHYKPMKTTVNEAETGNSLNREFSNQAYRNVVVSDLTYVRVGSRWHYICILLDLYNREIIGYSAGPYKDAQLVKDAFATVQGSLAEINLFHTDRGKEFKNQLIDDVLTAFEINRSLSKKGTPYDNAVAEAGFKTIKTELIHGETFKTLKELQLELFDYVNWYNNHRLHSSLGYLSPIEYKFRNFKNLSS